MGVENYLFIFFVGLNFASLASALVTNGMYQPGAIFLGLSLDARDAIKTRCAVRFVDSFDSEYDIKVL